ncbi:MAG: outer membrane beta-barrel protein [Pseudomonadota bacterium]
MDRIMHKRFNRNYSAPGLVLAALALSLATSSTLAADLDVPPAQNGWTGGYLGVAIGAGASSTDLNASLNLDDTPISAGLSGIGAEGLLWSAALGVDYQTSPRWVVGGMIDYTGSSIASTLNFAVPPASGGYDLTADHSFSVLARAGYLSGPDTLIYLLGGYTWQNYSGALSLTNVIDTGTQTTSYNFSLDGLTVGAGIENRLGNGLSAKLEYRFTDFEDVGIIPGFLTASPNSHTVRLGLNYKFGYDRGAVPDASAIAYNWTGFLVGIEAGAGINVTEFNVDAGGGNGGSFNGLSGEGGTLGVRVGYDHQFNERWVGGLQASARLSNMNPEATLSVGGPPLTASIDEEYQFALTARAGYLTTQDTMWYALAGYQWSSIDFNVLGGSVGSVDRDGLVLGLGVETALTDSVTVGLEYRYVDYEDFDILGAGIADAATSSHSAMVSLNYKFRP